MRFSLAKGGLSLICACLCALFIQPPAAHAQTVIATIQLQGSPSVVAVDPYTQKVFVAAGSGLQVIDESTNTVTGYISNPSNWAAVAVAVNPATGIVYLGAQNGGLFAFDEKTSALVGSANVSASSIAVNPATNVIWVSDFNSTVYAVDGKTYNILGTAQVNALENIAVNPANNHVYAAQDLFPGRVTVIDGKIFQTIANPAGGGDLSFDVGVDPLHNVYYSTDQFGTLSVFDGKTDTLTATVALPGQPSGIAVDFRTHKIFVSDVQSNNVYVVDGVTNTFTTTVAVGSSPLYSANDPARGLVYVGNTGQSQNYDPSSETLSVIKE